MLNITHSGIGYTKVIKGRRVNFNEEKLQNIRKVYLLRQKTPTMRIPKAIVTATKAIMMMETSETKIKIQ